MRRHARSTVIVLLAVTIPPLAGCGGDESDTVAVDLSATPFDAATDLRNASFSPDNARLVFTEDLVRALQEPDIWSLDIESMTLTNHTDDGVVEVSLGGDDDDGTLLDAAPAWTADGEIGFVRGRPDRDGAQLLRIGDDEAVTEIATLPSEGPVSYVFPLVPLPDGDLLAISSPPPGGGAQLFRIDAESGDVEPVATFPEDDLYLPRIVDVHGALVLVRSEQIVGSGRPGFTLARDRRPRHRRRRARLPGRPDGRRRVAPTVDGGLHAGRFERRVRRDGGPIRALRRGGRNAARRPGHGGRQPARRPRRSDPCGRRCWGR